MFSRVVNSTLNSGLLKSRSMLAGNSFFSNVFAVRSSSGTLYGIAADSSGNIYKAIGTTIAKINSEGVVQWQKTLSSSFGIEDICVDSSGNPHISGYISYAGRNLEMYTVKFDTSGTFQWEKVHGLAASNDYGLACSVEASGRVYSVGWTVDGGLQKPQILQYDSSGTLLWQRKWSITGNGTCISVDHANTYPYYVIYDDQGGYAACITAQSNSNGGLQWQRKLSKATTQVNGGSIVTNKTNGDAYVCGTMGGIPFLVKYDVNGTLQWQRQVTGATNFTAYGGHSIAIDSSSNIYYAVSKTGTTQYFKYNSSGTLQWQTALTYSSLSSNSQITLDGNGFFYNDVYNANAYIKIPTDGSKVGTTFTFVGNTYSYNTTTHAEGAGTLDATTSSLSQVSSSMDLSSQTSTVTNTSLTFTRTNW